MAEISRYLMAAGAHLVYGGDLRAGGFTQVLFEVAARHAEASGDERCAFTNVLPWPIHAQKPKDELHAMSEAVKPYGRLVLLSKDAGSELPIERKGARTALITDEIWGTSLSAMRRRVTRDCNARVVLGGTVAGYRGVMPGIAEEAYLSLGASQPLFLLGGFGGCAADVARQIGMEIPPAVPKRKWKGLEKFKHYEIADLRNGLTTKQSNALVATCFTDSIIPHLLKGLGETLNPRNPPSI